MAVNRFKKLNNSSDTSLITNQNQFSFNSNNYCFKKQIHLYSNNLNENNNCFYNKLLKTDPKLLKNSEQRLKTNGIKCVNKVNERDFSEQLVTDFSCDGMKCVPQWLKVLRLHKYSYLFSSVTYEELLNTTEAELERKNVTKGARNKLINCIKKLRNRPKILKSLEKDLIFEGFAGVGHALNELKSLLNTPFKAYNYFTNGSQLEYHNNTNSDLNLFILIDSNELQSIANNEVNGCDNNFCANLSDENLPEMFTRLIGIVYAILIENSNTDEETYNSFNSIIDKCISHEAFNTSQKSRLNNWNQRMIKLWTSRSCYRRSIDGRLQRNNSKRSEINVYDSSKPRAGSVLIRNHFSSITSNYSLSKSHKSVPEITEPLGFDSNFGHILSQKSQNEMRTRTQLYRTQSAPSSRIDSSSVENHIHLSSYECDQLDDIEKLCIRMTEQALGISDGGLLRNIHQDV